MPLMLKAFSVSVYIFAGIPSIHAQTDFSGSWIFKAQQSVSGNLYSNGSPKIVTIKQDQQSITMDKTTAGMNGDVASSETVGFDGKPVETVTPSHRKKTITGSWSADKKSFTELTLIYDNSDTTKLYHTVTDVWTLEEGQWQLDRKDKNHLNGEIWESKAVYNRQ